MSTLIERLNALSKKQLIALVCEYSKEKKSAALSSHSQIKSQIKSQSKSQTEKQRDNAVAIIGMSCRFPGAVDSSEALWELIASKEVAVSDKPDERWQVSDYLGEAQQRDKTYTMSAGLIDDINRFDANFFNLSPREAETMDPQQRLALEEIWRALEHAGIPASDCQDKNYGIFLGVGANEYMNFCRHHAREEDAGYIASGNVLNMIPGRAAYLLGVHGPVMAIDTACSSSLSAVHNAVNSLRKGECSMAIAGGINVLLDPENFVSLSQAKMLSPSGRCHTFDESADGYARAEGCGIVILKKLSQAMADKDNILAVIRGSAMSHNGRSASITAPSKKAQQQVITAALSDARLKAEDIDLIEAHGTGTALGDPIELHAIDAVYGTERENHPLHVSSIKANIGHAEAAAGIAGLIKMVLALRHKTLPPQANFSKLNPNIQLESDQIRIATGAQEWPRQAQPRAGAVSSFGFSGVNLHLVLQEFPARKRQKSEDPVSTPCILTLSAKSKASLIKMATQYIDFLENDEDSRIDDLCYTASVHRDHHPLRLCALAYSRTEMQQSLQQGLATLSQLETDKPCLTVSPLVLTGEGIFSPKLLLSLIHSFDSFKTVIKKYEATLLELGITDIHHYLEACEQNAGQLSLETEKDRAIVVLMGAVFLSWLSLLLPKFKQLTLYADGLIQLSLLTFLFDLDPIIFLNGVQTSDEIPLKLPKNTHLSFTDQQQLTLSQSLVDHIINAAPSPVSESLLKGNSTEQGAPVLIGEVTDLSSLSKQLMTLYEAGYDINWTYLYSHKHRLVEAPLYPYDRRHYWVEGGPVVFNNNEHDETLIENLSVKKRVKSDSEAKGKGGNEGETHYQFTISNTAPNLLDDHRLFNRIVVPGSFYLSLACRLFREQYPVGEFFLKHVQFKKALALNEEEERLLTIRLKKSEQGEHLDWFVESQRDPQAELIQHCQGQLSVNKSGVNNQEALDIQNIRENWRQAIESQSFYKDFDDKGYTLGTFFRYVGDGWINKNAILRKVVQPAETVNQDDWELHPGVLDSLFQVVGGLEELNFDTDKIFIPYQIQDFHLYRSQHSSPYFWCLAEMDERHQQSNGSGVRVKLSIYDHQLNLCLSVEGFELRAISRATVEKSLAMPSWFYKETWQPSQLPAASAEKKRADKLYLSTYQQDATLAGHFFSDWQQPMDKAGDANLVMRGVESMSSLIQDSISLNTQTLNFVWHLPLSKPVEARQGQRQAPQECFVLYNLLKTLTAEAAKGREIHLLLMIKHSDAVAAVYEPMLSAILRCFRQEQNEVTCKMICVDEGTQFYTDIDQHLQVIFQHPEAEFRFTNNQLQVRRLLSVENSEVLEKNNLKPAMQHVLITGATGGIGQQLAVYLARTENVKSLSLLGSRQKDETIDTLLEELKNSGIEARYYSLNLADPQRLMALLQSLQSNGIKIDTVFHAAAVIEDALIDNVKPTQLAQAFEVKCAAISTLLDCLPGLSTLVNFSSMAASVGAPGQSVYAATNAYLDGLADYYQSKGTRILSINWGPWKHVGMAARLSDQHKQILANKGIRQFSASHVFPLLIQLLRSKEHHLTLADIDAEVLAKTLPESDRQLFSESTSQDESDAGVGFIKEKVINSKDKEAFTLLHSFICSTVSTITRTEINKIKKTEAGFFSLGMDSLMILEFRKIVEKALSTKLESSVIFNYPNPQKLTTYLLNLLQQGQDESGDSQTQPASTNLSSHKDIDRIAQELEKELEL